MRVGVGVGALSLLLIQLLSPAVVSAQDGDNDSPVRRSVWQEAGTVGRIGSVAEVTVPDGCKFTGPAGVPGFLEATHNLPDPSVAAVMFCRKPDSATVWFVMYKYDPSGLVRDDDKNALDADKLLATIKDATDRANDERERRGWGKMFVTGWITPPFYDQNTHNLTWALEGVDAEGESSANREVRLLGRGGVVSVELVAEPGQLDVVVPEFDQVVGATGFVSGQKYAEWREGDKVASYGLVALVAGGAGLAAGKLGLFGKLSKLIIAAAIALKKLVIAIVVGIVAWFKRLFGKKKSTQATAG